MKQLYELTNKKNGKQIRTTDINKITALAFQGVTSEWHKEAKCYKEYMEKYPTMKEYDRHLDDLGRDEKKEFRADLLNNINNYTVFTIKAVEKEFYNREEQERVMYRR